MPNALPIAVIGAGPVGLAAAAHLLAAGEEPVVLEAGPSAGWHVAQWGHVRLFSPWSFNVDVASAALLRRHGWVDPPADEHPTGQELVDRYLAPLATAPEIASRLRTSTRVTAVTQAGRDRMKSPGRDEAPFVLRLAGPEGEEDLLARAVIDASGTWSRPNPLGAAGIPALGETALAERIAYGIPDVLGSDRHRYAGRRVLVVGSGHSAFNALMDLVALAENAPGTEITWAVRRPTLGAVFGGGERDALAERGRLGDRVRTLVESGAVRLLTSVRIDRLAPGRSGVVVHSEGVTVAEVDEIIGATGFRPDLSIVSELRLSIDPALESPTVLAPLIDPNVHSCGTVPPHGVDELAHPDADFYIVGMKSYGRAPTALLRTGYEQVRSVVAALAGDWEAARRVELVLPATGVCSLTPPADTSDGFRGTDPAPEQAAAGACCG
jgi:thioredoxin reductase